MKKMCVAAIMCLCTIQMMAENVINVVPTRLTAGTEGILELWMSNEEAVKWAEFDIRLPEGITITEWDFEGSRLNNQTTGTTSYELKRAMSEDFEKEEYRLVSTDESAYIPEGTGLVVRLHVAVDNDVSTDMHNIYADSYTFFTDRKTFPKITSCSYLIVGEPEQLDFSQLTDFVPSFVVDQLNNETKLTTTSYDFTKITGLGGIITPRNPNALMYFKEGTQAATLMNGNDSHNVVVGNYCNYLVITDGYDYSVPKGFTAKDAFYKRNAPSGFGTVVLPFVPNPKPKNIQFYELAPEANTDPGYLTFDEVDNPKHECPYIYSATENNFSAMDVEIFPTGEVEEVASQDGWTMAGVYTKQVFTPETDNIYALSNGKIYHNAGSLTVNPFRAYFHTSTTYNEVKGVCIGKTSAIQSLEIIDGMGEKRYNLAGQRVGNDYKGIVIENGKKILTK
ncbi:MAG: hypothetical protein MJY95_03655 [Bacteroidaceae bacterium]|nr:hypothetical protein [Bacteroidaceae bacterium]